LFLANRPEQSLKEHMVIFKAFKQKDGRKVRTLLEAHTSSSMGRSLKQLELKEKKGKS
jgi:DNA-binding GntR family transcriptional regulator